MERGRRKRALENTEQTIGRGIGAGRDIRTERTRLEEAGRKRREKRRRDGDAGVKNHERRGKQTVMR